jgi:hypothetical protein
MGRSMLRPYEDTSMFELPKGRMLMAALTHPFWRFKVMRSPSRLGVNKLRPYKKREP